MSPPGTWLPLPDSGSLAKPRARPMTLVGDGAGRRFVVDHNGLLYQLHADDSLSVFLDLAAATSLVANQCQKGLASAAFHPDDHVSGAAGFGKLYTASSQPASVTPDFPVPAGGPTSHHSVVHEWDVDPTDPNAGGVSAGAAPDPNGADPQCPAAWGDREASLGGGGCGLGPELVGLLPLLLAWRRRRGSRRPVQSAGSGKSPTISGSWSEARKGSGT